jgi:hypothetical protein
MNATSYAMVSDAECARPAVEIVASGQGERQRWWVTERSLAGLLASGPYRTLEQAWAALDSAAGPGASPVEVSPVDVSPVEVPARSSGLHAGGRGNGSRLAPVTAAASKSAGSGANRGGRFSR